MNQHLIVYTSEGVLLTFIVLAFLLLIMASIYDMCVVTKRQYFRQLARRLRRPKQPSVTILVYSTGAALALESSLESLRKSRYHHYDVVVVDNVSADSAKQIVKTYQVKHLAENVRLYQKRKKADRLTALRQGYHRSQKGELVLVLEAGDTVTPSFLKDGVVRFVADQKLPALRARQEYDTPLLFTTMTTQFVALTYALCQKSFSLIRKPRLRVGSMAVFYRASAFKRTPVVACRYDASLIVRTSLRPRPLGEGGGGKLIVGVIMSPLVFLLMTYFIVIAARLETASMLTLSWLAISVWCFVTIWTDETVAFTKKLSFIAVAPLAYFFLYVQLIIWIFGFMREFSHTLSRLSVYA